MIFVTNDDRMGKNIRYLRQTRSLSREVFAATVGMDCGTLAAIEEGILLEIDAQILLNICEWFRLDIQELIEDCV